MRIEHLSGRSVVGVPTLKRGRVPRNGLGPVPITILSIFFSSLVTFLDYAQGAMFRQNPDSWLVAPSAFFGATFLALLSFSIFPIITFLVFLAAFRRLGARNAMGGYILSLFVGGFLGAIVGNIAGFYLDLDINSSFFGNATVNLFIQPFALLVQGFFMLVVGLAARSISPRTDRTALVD